MIFSVIVLLLILTIGFFHYLQGLFSATLSAIIAIIAAALAVSFHEPLVGALLRGKFADQAHAIALIVLFSAIYLLLRIMFDSMVPGNIRLPAIVDKVGGAAMGLIAGVFAIGIMVTAGQTLPFGPSIAQYTRYETTGERGAVIASQQRGKQALDEFVYDEVTADTFDEATENSLLIPADDMVIGTVSYLSEGSLSGKQPLEAVHPDYLQELFGNRLGVQVGAKHTALKIGGVQSIHTVKSLPQVPAELLSITDRQIPMTLSVPDDQMILIVRTIFDLNATDKDDYFRFSPGSVRLVANGRNYFPVGTLDNGSILKNNRIDDFLLVNLKEGDRGADLVFVVYKEDVLGTPESGATSAMEIAAGTFLEVKRLAREDLSGKPISTSIAADERMQVLRKGAPPERRRAPRAPAGAPPPGPEGAMPPAPPGQEDVPMSPAGVPSAR